MDFYVMIVQGKYYRIPQDVLDAHAISKEDYETAVEAGAAELMEKPDVDGQGLNFCQAVAGVRG